ncbi:molybdate ABC transporter substrate-binding protein [Halomonas sp. PR-M31]|uniref:molybdate ABC transporter substrate-binding protein n=1 Tax=Halomonas sp. PR-M31 TaxID=1471202 RepID=UPI0006515AB3|nr:molybdate ABC transporter substrate-binding protein [Halomonas sp. PR-M31]
MFKWQTRHRASFKYTVLIRGFLLFALLGVAFLAQADTAKEKPGVKIFAAASLTDALNEAIDRYEAQHDVDIVPVYASSSTAARQIANGAPAELFFSANVQWMDWLPDQGIELDSRTNLLQNHLVLIALKERDLPAFTPGNDGKLVSLLDDQERLSVGDPDHVPAGIYSKQALQSLGEWDALEPRLARADNVRAALALVEQGEAPLGIVYQTDAKASDKVDQLSLFPADSHDPIVYPLALVNLPVSEPAQAFRQWLESDEALAIFADFGFAAAQDASP